MKKIFTANLIQICNASEAGQHMFPIIEAYSYPVPVSDQDLVAILHIVGTSSFHAIPLHSCSSFHELETKIVRDLGAELTYPSQQILENYFSPQTPTHFTAPHEARSLVSSH